MYLLAAECKTRQGKESKNEINEASNLFLKYSDFKKFKECERVHYFVLQNVS